MTVESRLRESMRAYTERVEPTTDGWPRLTDRLEPRRRRPWLVAAAAGFAAILAMVAVLYVVVDSGTDESNPSSAATLPSRIVAVTTDRRLVVLSSRDGHIIRVLATDAFAGRRVQLVAVTPDGRRVYFAKANPLLARCTDYDQTDIAAIPTTGGREQTVATFARAPAVSPDGRFLAYAGVAGCTTDVRTIVVHRIAQPTPDRIWRLPGAVGVLDLSWARDSRRLAFAWIDSVGGPYPRILDTTARVPLDEAPTVKLGAGTDWFGYLGGSDRFLGYHFLPTEPGTAVTLRPSGAVAKKLLDLPGPAPATLTSDSSGKNILLLAPNGELSSTLLRWTKGDRQPIEIAAGIVAAVWVPERKP